MSKIIIAGGTGFLGKYLGSKFTSSGHEVIKIARTGGDVNWQDKEGVIRALNQAAVVINLAGKSVDCRYNEKNKKEIIHSRVHTTELIGTYISSCEHPPELWMNASTATIYRHSEDRAMTEETGEIGSGFSVNVALQWEKTFFDFHLPQTRQVALRMAIVLGNTGGAIKPLVKLAQAGLGGKQGNGKQMFSWIHIDDLYNIIPFLIDHKDLSGVFNCSSPNPVDNKTFMKQLRNRLHLKIGLSSPKWLLELGALFIGTETELILKSRWVIPERLQKAGYKFSYETLPLALEQILSNGAT